MPINLTLLSDNRFTSYKIWNNIEGQVMMLIFKQIIYKTTRTNKCAYTFPYR